MQYKKGDKVFVINGGATFNGVLEVKRHLGNWVTFVGPKGEIEKQAHHNDCRLYARNGCSHFCLDCGNPHKEIKEKVGPKGQLFMWCVVCNDFTQQSRLNEWQE